MRILHVIPTVSVHDGGPSVAIRAMARGVAALGAEVTVATTNVDRADKMRRGTGEPVMEDGVQFRYFPTTLPGAWKFSWSLTDWLRQNLRRFDIVHVHALFSYATIPACRIARADGVPYILRPLGTLDPWSLGQKSWKKWPYFHLIERHHLRHADAVHVTSAQEQASVEALGTGAPTALIPLGVDTSLPLRATRVAAGRRLRVAFLSRLHPKKGLPLVFAALHQLRSCGRDVELVVAGSGTPEYERFLKRQVHDLGLDDAVEFSGQVDGEAKWSLLASADVFVLPSFQENFGIAVVEALAAGLPVVVSDQVGVAASIKAAGAGIVVACDAGALAAALLALGDDPATRGVMGANGRRLARDEYSWTRCCQRLYELYHSLQGERTASHDGRAHGIITANAVSL